MRNICWCPDRSFHPVDPDEAVLCLIKLVHITHHLMNMDLFDFPLLAVTHIVRLINVNSSYNGTHILHCSIPCCVMDWNLGECIFKKGCMLWWFGLRKCRQQRKLSTWKLAEGFYDHFSSIHFILFKNGCYETYPLENRKK